MICINELNVSLVLKLDLSIRKLFSGIPWSTSEVLQETVKNSEKLGLKISYLPYLTDVDTAKDLAVWEKYSQILKP